METRNIDNYEQFGLVLLPDLECVIKYLEDNEKEKLKFGGGLRWITCSQTKRLAELRRLGQSYCTHEPGKMPTNKSELYQISRSLFQFGSFLNEIHEETYCGFMTLKGRYSIEPKDYEGVQEIIQLGKTLEIIGWNCFNRVRSREYIDINFNKKAREFVFTYRGLTDVDKYISYEEAIVKQLSKANLNNSKLCTSFLEKCNSQ